MNYTGWTWNYNDQNDCPDDFGLETNGEMERAQAYYMKQVALLLNAQFPGADTDRTRMDATGADNPNAVVDDVYFDKQREINEAVSSISWEVSDAFDNDV